MSTPLPRLHAITNSDILALSDLTERATVIGRSPDVALHARAPGVPGRMLVEFAEVLLRATSVGGARLFVNDRVDVALLAGAEGVHLPAGGLPISRVRALVGPDRWIGRSTHSPAEAQRAADEGADYVFLGPIWETPSHPGQGQGQGQGRERARGRPGIGVTAIEQVRAVRIIAIGGITPDRVAHCLDAGAYGVAAITSLWRAPDPGSAAAEMLLLLENT